MTPKEQYEARKAARYKLKDMDVLIEQRTSQVMTLDMIDRFVTAAERIADAMEKRDEAYLADLKEQRDRLLGLALSGSG
jgi:hypothetical protein